MSASPDSRIVADYLSPQSPTWKHDTWAPISLEPVTASLVAQFAALLDEAGQLTREGIDRLLADIKADREARP